MHPITDEHTVRSNDKEKKAQKKEKDKPADDGDLRQIERVGGPDRRKRIL